MQPCDFTLTVAALGAGIETTAKSLRAGQKYSAEFLSRLAAFDGRMESLGLGSAKTEKLTVQNEFQQIIYDVDVAQGATKIEARIGGASDPVADVDLYLFDATSDVPFLAAFSAHDGSEKHAEVLNPKPGKWKVVVDPYRLPHGPVQIDYHDTFYHDAFGKIEIAPDKRQGQQSGTDKAKIGPAGFTVNIHARPELPRTLVGAINVVSDDVYVTIVDPDAKVPEPNPLEFPKPVPTKNILLPIQVQVFSVE